MNIDTSVSKITAIIRGLIKDMPRIDGRDVNEYIGDNVFTLSKSFIKAETIQVFHNGSLLDDTDWDYDVDTNQVIIELLTSGQSLETNDLIEITYSYYKKYSDEEILGYLKSSLSYFPIHRYKKTFDIQNDTTIIAINNTDPTIDELYFIALIASIVIDPQNISVDIPGTFKISANRDMSDQEQILSAFRQFKSFVGTFYLNITEYERRP